MLTYNYSGITKAGSKYFNLGGLWPYINSTQVGSKVKYNKKYTSASLKLAAIGPIGAASLKVKGKFLYSMQGTIQSGVLKIPKFGKLKLSGLSLKVIKFNHYNFSDLEEGDMPEKVIGSKYNDKYYGHYENDKLYGRKGNDKLYGGEGHDKLYGGKGNDKLYGRDGEWGGDPGTNKLYGGKGNDLLVAEGVNDQLTGGKGKDIFNLVNADNYAIIKDFKDKKDKIYIGSLSTTIKNFKNGYAYIYKVQKWEYGYVNNGIFAKVKGAAGELSKKGKYLV